MAIEDYLFPMQSLTSKAAMQPEANAMPFFTGLAGLRGAQGAGATAGAGSQFGQMAGMVDQYADIRDSQQPQMDANSFASQTPGPPSQPGRIDQSSFGGQQMNPLDLLSANIAKRFGGM